MEYVLVVCLLCLFSFKYTASHSMRLVRDQELDNKIPIKGTKNHKNVDCVEDCASICLDTLLCRGILYRDVDKICLSYDVTMDPQHTTDHLPGIISYLKHPTECDKLGYIDVGPLCFKLMDTKMEWQDGRNTCKNQSGDLIVLNTEQKWNIFFDSLHVLDNVVSNYFIGLSDIDNEGSFMWVDDTAASEFKHFGSSQPNNMHHNAQVTQPANCGRVNTRHIDVHDDSCSHLRNFVCEIRFPI